MLLSVSQALAGCAVFVEVDFVLLPCLPFAEGPVSGVPFQDRNRQSQTDDVTLVKQGGFDLLYVDALATAATLSRSKPSFDGALHSLILADIPIPCEFRSKGRLMGQRSNVTDHAAAANGHYMRSAARVHPLVRRCRATT